MRRRERPLSAGEAEHIEFSGPCLTILFPADKDAALAPVRRSLAVTGVGLSRHQLLDFIHNYYQACMQAALLHAETTLLRTGEHAKVQAPIEAAYCRRSCRQQR